MFYFLEIIGSFHSEHAVMHLAVMHNSIALIAFKPEFQFATSEEPRAFLLFFFKCLILMQLRLHQTTARCVFSLI